ncbi:MAG TPA: hypothetical protein VE077_03165 [Candidatus Methylomirabilis sp.]|nr:hypothetical protein [Candidatus Methylomirabilis sp.]
MLTLVSMTAAMAIVTADWAMLGACLALGLATTLFIFYIQPDASDLAPHRSRLDQLLERRDTVYDNLRDLRFEFRSGKYAEHDYEAMKATLENEAALAIAEIEQITESQVRRPRAKPATTERGAQ